jgi:HD superfamily phosphodiesterase
MKLYGLYIVERDGEEAVPAPTSVEDIDTEKATEQANELTENIRNTIRLAVEDLRDLPVMGARTQSRDDLEALVESMEEYVKSFEAGGRAFDIIVSAIMTKGK